MKKKNVTKKNTAKNKVVKKEDDVEVIDNNINNQKEKVSKVEKTIVTKNIESKNASNKSNNAFIWIVAIVIVALLLSVVYFKTTKKQGYTEISYSELRTKMDNKENIVLFIGKASCSACSMYKEILNSQYKYNQIIYYIDLDKLSDEEKASFNSTFDYSATPTTIVITNGTYTSQDKVTGSDGLDIVVSLMKKKGLIK